MPQIDPNKQRTHWEPVANAVRDSLVGVMDRQEYDDPPEDPHVRRDAVRAHCENTVDFYSKLTSQEMGAFMKIDILGTEFLRMTRELDADESIAFDRSEFVHAVGADRCGIDEFLCTDGDLVQETTTWVKDNEHVVQEAFSGAMISLPDSEFPFEVVPAGVICWDILSIQRFVGRPFELTVPEAANQTKNVLAEAFGALSSYDYLWE